MLEAAYVKPVKKKTFFKKIEYIVLFHLIYLVINRNNNKMVLKYHKNNIHTPAM